MGLAASVIVFLAGQPDPAAPGNLQPGNGPDGIAAAAIVLVVGAFFLINHLQEKRKGRK